ncbi:hypothetical protein [Paenibacillus sp. UMB4589-SE434]|uniref:hypothetical protein n=1 Tax=Paenibacillus sp. UMB4589-SE434 TaxID=3046314 RepID=UPI0025506C2A|nr:hypothetical protein [Paenibacillus sp. UMB4589-SE434]MDK8180746.1 hypothetical protein [Paenibacillus sp. UMB4589-SE434]
MGLCLSNNASIIFNFMVFLNQKDNEKRELLHNNFPSLFTMKWNGLVDDFVPQSVDETNRDFVRWDNKHVLERTDFFGPMFRDNNSFEYAWNRFSGIWYTDMHILDINSDQVIPRIGEHLMQMGRSEGIDIKGNYCIQVIIDKPSYDVTMQNKNFILATVKELESTLDISKKLYDMIKVS